MRSVFPSSERPMAEDPSNQDTQQRLERLATANGKHGDLVALYRVVRQEDIVFSEELDRIAETRGAKVNYVVGDHLTADGGTLLSPAHLQELVPDIAERDVFLCGPVAMIDWIIPNLRHANVSRRHLHVERFSL